MVRKLGIGLMAVLAAGTLALGGCSDDDSGAQCGNDLIEGSETCDGSQFGGATCQSLGFTGGTLACSGSCTIDTSGCTEAQCGDGVANGTEECDDTDLRYSTCEAQGFVDGTLGCNTDCTYDTTACIAAGCGNGMVDGTEECDDTDLAHQTCLTRGFTGGTLACTGTCTFDETNCTDNCGNSSLDTGEVCDGDLFGTATCVTENFDGGTLACVNDCSALVTSGCCNDTCTTDGATTCSGNTLRLCEIQANGCLGYSDTNCTTGGQVCTEAGGSAQCSDACTSDCTTAGETVCAGNTLRTCTAVSTCLVYSDTNCGSTGDVCSGTPAACVAPTGDCTLPYYINMIQLPDGTWDGTGIGTTISGGTSHVGSAPCDNWTSGSGPDLIYQLDVPTAMDATIVMTPNPSFDAALRLLGAPCDLATEVGDPNDSRGDGCADAGNPETLRYKNLPAGTYYVVADGYGTGSYGTFDLRVTLATTTCGNGQLDGHESCDDGDTDDGDGCSSQCAIEDGYECAGAPSACQLICSNGVIDSGEECDDGGVGNGDGCASDCTIEAGAICTSGEPSICGFPEPATLAGDLVITEIMQNPNAVLDNVGEWFEIHNPTNKFINLYDMVVSDAGTDSFTIDATIIMYPGDYVVLGNNVDTGTNGGVTLDYVYPATYILGNSDDEVILTAGGVMIDTVAYDNGATFPDPTGASMSLDPGSLDDVSNDTGTNWCTSPVFSYGDGDLGTPGVPNIPCGTTALLSESFETWPPTNWTIENLGGASTWEQCDACGDTLNGSTGSFAFVDSDAASGTESFDDSLESPSVDCTGYSACVLTFVHYYNDYSIDDSASVELSIGGGAWVPLVTYTADTANGAMAAIPLAGAAGQADVRVRFHYVAEYDWYWRIDDVKLVCAP